MPANTEPEDKSSRQKKNCSQGCLDLTLGAIPSAIREYERHEGSCDPGSSGGDDSTLYECSTRAVALRYLLIQNSSDECSGARYHYSKRAVRILQPLYEAQVFPLFLCPHKMRDYWSRESSDKDDRRVYERLKPNSGS